MTATEANAPVLEGPWDLIVVGHGAAGLSTALSYLETRSSDSPPRVAVLDRNDVAARGGSTAWTTSGMRLGDDSQLDPEWETIVRETSRHHVNEPYITAFYENAVETVNWLKRRGIRFVKVPNPMPVTFASKATFPEGGGRAIVDTLTPQIVDMGAAIFYETTALRLVTDDQGAIRGLVVRDADDVVHTMSAPVVVLACGGFEANPEMLSRYIPNAHRLDVVSPGTRANTGDGLRMAMEIGAATAGQFDRAHLEPVDPRSSNLEGLVLSWIYGILVDSDGKRFMDEAEHSPDIQFDIVANRVFSDAQGRAFAIIDAGVRAAAPVVGFLNCQENAPISAPSLDELADKLGITRVALRETVEQYNAAAGGTEGFDASRFDEKATVGLEPRKSNWALPLSTPPFEAVPVGANICFTFGGILVDGRSRVLNTAGRPIRGLYAAGEVTGLFHEVYPAGTSVLRSLTFGRIAGADVAEGEATSESAQPEAVLAP